MNLINRIAPRIKVSVSPGDRILWIVMVMLFQTTLLFGKIRNVVTGFGADATGQTYATVNIQNAINACLPGDTLLFPEGRFLLNDGLNLKSSTPVEITTGQDRDAVSGSLNPAILPSAIYRCITSQTSPWIL